MTARDSAIERAHIPAELQGRAQWLLWRFEPGEKKPKKMPYYASGARRVGKQGDEADRAKLVSLDKALATLSAPNSNPFSGIGFAFLPDDGLIGIDIDGCIDLETGEINQRAAAIIDACNSYTEYSPSGKGVHIIVAGTSDTFKSNEIGLEVFCGRQFFTFSARPYPGAPQGVNPIDLGVLNRLRLTVKGVKTAREAQPVPVQAVDERSKLESALACISPDCGYDQWIRVGMGVYAALGGAGFEVWNYWSSKGNSYSGPDDLLSHWKSFDGQGGITEATVYKLAVDQGWRPPLTERRPLALVKSAPPPSDVNAPSGTGETSPEAGAAKAAGKGAGKKSRKVYSEEHWNTVDYLLAHFVLIYGTDDAYDEKKRMIIKIAHLRLAYSSDAVKFWLNNPGRRMVNKDDVVFDPTGQADPETTVNLYHGFEMQPKPGKCDKIVELLKHLCNEDAEVLAWVLRWIAYPLQSKGAKMRTSIIIHGDEGSGKNLFWENVVRRIYGEYGGVIGNAQIESQFNEWASRKLFFVADEVVTRNELRQLKGKLKHMVTGETIMINPKGMTERAEANHMNFVFLSNELQPLALDKSDRRYLVLWTPPNKSAEFYKETADQIDNGGVEAFYHYLMQVPLEDFNEHTKPIVTEAKTKLIGLGLSPPEKFYREWSGGFLPLPFVCCSAMQLYLGFCRWCHLNGERFPMTQTMFGRTIDRVGIGQVHRAIIKYELGNEVKQRTVYLVGEMPPEKSRTQWVEDASDIFEKHLKKYRHVYDQTEEVAAVS